MFDVEEGTAASPGGAEGSGIPHPKVTGWKERLVPACESDGCAEDGAVCLVVAALGCCSVGGCCFGLYSLFDWRFLRLSLAVTEGA